MRSSLPASVLSTRSTTPTASTSPVNNSKSSLRQTSLHSRWRWCVDRHLIIAEALRVNHAPAPSVAQRSRRQAGECIERLAPEDNGCPEDNQAVDQCLLQKRGCERRAPLHEE